MNFWNFADRVILYRFETEASACHKNTEKCEGGPQTGTQLPQIPFSMELLSRKDFADFDIVIYMLCCLCFLHRTGYFFSNPEFGYTGGFTGYTPSYANDGGYGGYGGITDLFLYICEFRRIICCFFLIKHKSSVQYIAHHMYLP